VGQTKAEDMRWEDVADYFKLRAIAENPVEIIRFRKDQGPDKTLVIRLQNGHPLHILGGTDQRHIFHRIYLRDEYRLNRYQGQKWRCTVDLGANVGIFSSRAAPFCNRVICYEPISENFQQLKKNVEEWSNIFPVKKAVAAKKGTVKIYRPNHRGWTGRYSIIAQKDGQSSMDFDEIQAITLDDLFEEHRIVQCDLLKIDVEGAEYDILEATSNETFAKIQRIFGEYHHPQVENPKMNIHWLSGYLKAVGFDVEVAAKRKKSKNYGMFFATRTD
jgi:FkbM family methyltransferase